MALNGRARTSLPQTTPTDAIERAGNEMLASYGLIEDAWKKAEAKLALSHVPVDVQIEVGRGYNDDPDPNQMPLGEYILFLGYIKRKNQWRICLIKENHWYHADPDTEYRPIAESSLDVRLEMFEWFEKLHNEVVAVTEKYAALAKEKVSRFETQLIVMNMWRRRSHGIKEVICGIRIGGRSESTCCARFAWPMSNLRWGRCREMWGDLRLALGSRIYCGLRSVVRGRECAWHRAWKRKFPRRWREFVIEPHRADVKSPRGVIELQSSSISTKEIAERETFYGEMVWLIDAQSFSLTWRHAENHVKFHWKRPRQRWWFAQKPLFFDLGNHRVLQIRRIHRAIDRHGGCSGWGWIVSDSEFVARFSSPKRGEALCDYCKMPFPNDRLIKTEMCDFYTMDLNPETPICAECYEEERSRFIPDDLDLIDCYTPI